MPSYQSTVVVRNIEDEPLVDHTSRTRNHGKCVLGGTFLLLASMAIFLFNSKSGGTVQESSFPEMGKGSPSSPACSFTVCEMSGCPVDVAPYACTGWTDPNLKTVGCAPMPWIVGAIGSTCIESCDLSDCKNAEPEDSSVTCDGVLCEDCESVKCGSGAPYQCLGGSSRYACSSDAYYYNILPKTQCDGCCDTRECSK